MARSVRRPAPASALPSTSPLSRLGMALGTSVLAGLLVAAVALPLVGGVGLSAKAAADEFLVLPAELETPPLAQRTRILANDGTLLAILYRENRVAVPLTSVPELTRKAVLAIEDSRFYAHNGVDVKGTARAAVENARRGGVSQGGSTLTQQYVKNALIQAAPDREAQDRAREVSLDRKLQEARYALAIERKLTKDEILERYLNIAYYSNGVYGIGTAANYYFAKPVGELTLAEGALLAGVVQSPGRFDPVRNVDAAVSRRNIVLQRMREVGFITEVERAEASAETPNLQIRPVGNGCEDPAVQSPFFCDYVRRALETTELGQALGATREERQSRILGGGLTIKTTLDPVIQQGAQDALERRVPRDDPSQVAGVVDVVEPGTGHVKAMAVNRSFSEEELPGHSKVNFAIGGSQGFQGGSTFKPFVLARAVQMGLPLSLTLFSPQQYSSKVFKDCRDNSCDNPYEPSNAGDSQSGTFDMRSGTAFSVNTYYVQLLERTGIESPAALAESLGVKRFENGSASAPLQRVPSFVLGVDGVSPLDMATAYATFAARGLHCPPRPVTEILDASNQPIELPAQRCEQVLEQEVADTVNSVLTEVVDGPRGRTGGQASIGRPTGGKTGSTNGSTAAWFIGYTPQLATAVWVGKATPEPMRRISIGGRYYAQVFGGSLPAPIFRDTMQVAVQGLPVERFATPDRAALRGEDVEIPDVRGLSEDDARVALNGAGLTVRTGARVNAAPVPAGQAAYTSPRAGNTVRMGSSVTLYLSNGRASSSGTTTRTTVRAPAPAPEPVVEQPAEQPAGPGNGPGNGQGSGPGNAPGNGPPGDDD